MTAPGACTRPSRGWFLAATGIAVLVLGLARLVTGPWSQTYYPPGARLLEGWPVSWETVYYLPHLATFLGDGFPTHTVSGVHYRTLLGLDLAALLSVWTGSVYWAFALVDLFFWWLAVVATHALARRLGVDEPAARIAAMLTLASPVMISNLWRNDLHTANFATLPIGLWAAVVLIEEQRSPGVGLGLKLGLLLLILSLSYQYQWIVLAMLPALIMGTGRFSPRRMIGVITGAAAAYVVGSLAVRLALILGRLDPLTNLAAEHMAAVSEPVSLITARVEEFRGSHGVGAFPLRWDHITSTIQIYHPWVFAVALGGLLLCGGRVLWPALVASVMSLASYVLYPAPWTAMSAYPLLYIGAGVGCCAIGLALGRATDIALRGPGRRWQLRVGGGLATLCALCLAAVTNLDLVGNHSYAIAWWWLYFVPPVF